MNDFSVIGDACFAHRIIRSPGGKYCKSLQRNVWRGVVCPLKKSVFRDRLSHFAVILWEALVTNVGALWQVKWPLFLTYILLTKLFPLDFLSERIVNLLIHDILVCVTNLPLPISYSCFFALADLHKTRKNYKLAFTTL